MITESPLQAKRRFERDVLPLSNALFGAAMRLTKDREEAEDLVQDTLVRAYRFWSTFKVGTNVKAWMFTILRNTFINGYHRRNRTAKISSSLLAQTKSAGLALVNSPSSTDAESRIDIERTHQLLHEALEQLPPKYREAVTLADLEGLSYAESAAAAGVKMGTIMSRIYRGRVLLHGMLRDHARLMGLLAADAPGERRTQYTRTPMRVAS